MDKMMGAYTVKGFTFHWPLTDVIGLALYIIYGEYNLQVQSVIKSCVVGIHPV